jgi:DNA-binding transcriptional LysR family regulator
MTLSQHPNRRSTADALGGELGLLRGWPDAASAGSGDPYGFVDKQLERQGRARRIALTVPNVMFALAAIAETDFISALPQRFVTLHAVRFGAVAIEPALPLPGFRLNTVAPKVAMMDAAWRGLSICWKEQRQPRQRAASIRSGVAALSRDCVAVAQNIAQSAGLAGRAETGRRLPVES